MAEPYPHNITTGSPPAGKHAGGPTGSGEPAGSDAGQDASVAAEHPKGARAPLPPGHPSSGTIDEGGEQR